MADDDTDELTDDEARERWLDLQADALYDQAQEEE
jgi:hypothetical protein